MQTPTNLDHVKITLGSNTYDVLISLGLLEEIEDSFGAMSFILSEMEKGCFGYRKLVDLLECILQQQKIFADDLVPMHLIDHGIAEINQAVFQVLARFSLGKNYLHQIVGDPILGEELAQTEV